VVLSALASALVSLGVSARREIDHPELVAFLDGVGEMLKALAACPPDHLIAFRDAHAAGAQHH
jgi:hypothetical protein